MIFPSKLVFYGYLGQPYSFGWLFGIAMGDPIRNDFHSLGHNNSFDSNSRKYVSFSIQISYFFWFWYCGQSKWLENSTTCLGCCTPGLGIGHWPYKKFVPKSQAKAGSIHRNQSIRVFIRVAVSIRCHFCHEEIPKPRFGKSQSESRWAWELSRFLVTPSRWVLRHRFRSLTCWKKRKATDSGTVANNIWISSCSLNACSYRAFVSQALIRFGYHLFVFSMFLWTKIKFPKLWKKPGP